MYLLYSYLKIFSAGQGRSRAKVRDHVTGAISGSVAGRVGDEAACFFVGCVLRNIVWRSFMASQHGDPDRCNARCWPQIWFHVFAIVRVVVIAIGFFADINSDFHGCYQGSGINSILSGGRGRKTNWKLELYIVWKGKEWIPVTSVSMINVNLECVPGFYSTSRSVEIWWDIIIIVMFIYMFLPFLTKTYKTTFSFLFVKITFIHIFFSFLFKLGNIAMLVSACFWMKPIVWFTLSHQCKS